MGKELNKYELCAVIASICDELEATKRELSIINRNVDNTGLGLPDLYCLEVGRRKVFKESTYCVSWHAQAERKDDGTIAVTPFEDWKERVVYKIPDTMSKAGFMIYFHDLLKERYAKDCAEAIENLEASEVGDSE